MRPWEAPREKRDFNYYVTAHAISKYRERAPNETGSRTDRDVALLIDSRISSSMDAKLFDRVVDSDAPDTTTYIVAFETSTGVKMFAVLRTQRPSSHPPINCLGPNGVALGVVTVLTHEMGSKAFATGRWVKAPDTAPAHSPTAPLATKPFASALAGVVPNPLPAKPAPAPVPTARHGVPLGAPRSERFEAAVTYLREHVGASNIEVSNAMKAKYGTGMGDRLLTNVRAEALKTIVQAKMREQPIPVPAPDPAPPPAPIVHRTRIMRMPEVTRGPGPEASNTVVQLYVSAIESERLSRQRVTELEAQLALARESSTTATKQVEQLLAQMQAQRSS